MCMTCKDRFYKNPLRIIDCKESVQEDYKGRAGAAGQSLRRLQGSFYIAQDNLGILGIHYEIDKNIVRGLDYYTKTVFEFVSENVGTQGTICGGGRYDGLIEQFGGPATPGIGFALGLERLLMEIDAQGLPIAKPEPSAIYFATLGQQGADAARVLCSKLRKRASWRRRILWAAASRRR